MPDRAYPCNRRPTACTVWTHTTVKTKQKTKQKSTLNTSHHQSSHLTQVDMTTPTPPHPTPVETLSLNLNHAHVHWSIITVPTQEISFNIKDDYPVQLPEIHTKSDLIPSFLSASTVGEL